MTVDAKPNYTHDCDTCEYLGAVTAPNPFNAQLPVTTWDLWHCPRCDGGSVIARYGSEGPDYMSSPTRLLHHNSHPALLWGRAFLHARIMSETGGVA